jgi:hypothetical protein
VTPTTQPPSAGDSEGQRLNASTGDALQLWQHFVSTAGEDKNRMITITSWLLGLSASIIGLVLTQNLDSDNERVLSAFGIVVSVFAVYIVLLYGSHERWNRTKADTLAATHPTLAAILRPGEQPRGGAWVFGFFLGLALLSLIAHVIMVA